MSPPLTIPCYAIQFLPTGLHKYKMAHKNKQINYDECICGEKYL